VVTIRPLPPLFIVRDRQVILDSDLAALFGVPTRRLNEQIRRNRERFPEDFAFVLTRAEVAALMSQIATSKKGRGGRRKPPVVLTEHGVVMAANVLNSPRAVLMSLEVVRAFVRLRKAAHSDEALRDEVARLGTAVRRRLRRHDADIEQLFKAVERLIEGDPRETSSSVRRIGFVP
jgi:hypothetical protein